MFTIRLLFVALVWGINFSVIKFTLAEIHPLSFTVVRFALASAFLFTVMYAAKTSFYIARQDRLSLVKLGFFGISLYNFLFMYGLKHTTAANSAMLISLSPLFGALFLASAGKERITPRMGLGLFLASAGVFLVIRSQHGAMVLSASGFSGDLLTLFAAISWAIYSIAAKPLLAKYSPLAVTAYSVSSGTVLLLPISMPALIAQPWHSVSLLSWSALMFAALIAAGIAYVLWYQGIQRIGVTRTMTYHYLMPIAAVIFAALFLHERIALLQMIGGASILLGIFLVQSKYPAAGQ